MTTLLEKIREAQSNQSAKFLLNDRHWSEHQGNRYQATNTMYDFTLDKKGNSSFDRILKGDKVVTLRANVNGSVTAVTFIFDSIAFQGYNADETKAMGVHGTETGRETFVSFAQAKKQYPDMFTKAKELSWKRANIVTLR